MRRITNKIRNILSKLFRKYENDYILGILLRSKLLGYIRLNDVVITDDELERIVFENLLEKKKHVYLSRIKAIVLEAIKSEIMN